MFRNKEGHQIMIKEPIHQDITMLNVYVPNSIDENYMKQNLIEMKREIHKLTSIVGDSKTPLPTIDRTTTQKSRKDREQ